MGWGNLGSISTVETLSGCLMKILLSLRFPKALSIKGGVALAIGKLTQGDKVPKDVLWLFYLITFEDFLISSPLS